MGALVAAFEKKYGVKVNIWRASSREGAAARGRPKREADRNTVDVVETNGPELESMHREKILQRGRSRRITPTSSRRRSVPTASGSARA